MHDIYTYVGLDLLVHGRHDHLRRRDRFHACLLRRALLTSPTGDDVTSHVTREQVRRRDGTTPRGEKSTFDRSLKRAIGRRLQFRRCKSTLYTFDVDVVKESCVE